MRQEAHKTVKKHWSGGATPAHGMRISCVEAGPAGGWCLSVHNAGAWISSSAERRRKFEFGTRFWKMFIKKWFSSRSRKRRVRWSKKVPLYTLCGFLSRNASFFALKAWLTFIFDDKCEKWQNFDANSSYTCEKVAPVSFFTFFTNH